ncbi:baseplate assembly protein [Afifella sp. H1R]|uniref:baseplate assembly protein n=1 Tax=Afifella sp. H1R TaxID=2908841 RepID=UPI001F3DBFED|nr:baseplate assembly protein [Afifella sp. H1R]MCF1502907.1 baseplate assembly protein [Afifella sp. H1R]
MSYQPTVIDLSRVPAPAAIEALDYEALQTGFLARFVAAWDAQRLADPTLPAWDVGGLETDPAVIAGEAWAYLRLLDRARVNDAVRAVLAPLASGFDLDNVAASANVERLVVREATAELPEILESDAALLRRYLLSFDRPSAGSRGRCLYEAWSAWPSGFDEAGDPIGMGDAVVNGRAVHGRRGDTDVVITGPAGRDPTDAELAQVRAAVLADTAYPEAIALSVIRAARAEYTVALTIDVPPGPDASVIAAESTARVRAAADSRTLIGAEIPAGYLAGAAYGANVIKVRDDAPVAIDPDPYTVPVCTAITVTPEVRA